MKNKRVLKLINIYLSIIVFFMVVSCEKENVDFKPTRISSHGL